MDPGTQFTLGDRVYTVLRLGAPVHRKSAMYDHLKHVGFTAANLTVLGLPADDGSFGLHYVVWCLGAEEQRIVSKEMFDKLARDAPKDDAEEQVTLPSGRTVAIPLVPGPGSRAKRQKRADAPGSAFVIRNDQMVLGHMDPGLVGSRFGGPETPAALAARLAVLEEAPCLETLRGWAREVLAA
jgi:hypothetical protein